MLVETGYAISTISYPRPPRTRGRSNNNFFALLDFALSGLAGSSKKLVRMAFYVGVLGLIGSLAALVAAPLAFVLGRSGWRWLAVALLEFNFGVLCVFLGIIGDQIRLISERTRNTPLVIERERLNLPPGY